MYGIDKKVYKNLINYFQNNSNIEKVIIFGSRAKGTENMNSDIEKQIDRDGIEIYCRKCIYISK